MKQQVNLKMEKELLAKVDAFADSLGLNRTSAICLMCAQHLQSVSNMSTLNELLVAYKLEQEQRKEEIVNTII